MVRPMRARRGPSKRRERRADAVLGHAWPKRDQSSNAAFCVFVRITKRQATGHAEEGGTGSPINCSEVGAPCQASGSRSRDVVLYKRRVSLAPTGAGHRLVEHDGPPFVNDTQMRRIVRANPCFRAIQSVCKCPRDEGPSALDDLARRVHFEGEQRQRVLHLLRLILLRRSTGHVNKGYTVQSFCCLVAVSPRAPRRRCRCLAVVVPQA